MKQYLCQTREGEQADPNPFQRRGRCTLRWTPWKTVRTESPDEHGGARAETWLLLPVRGITQRRIKLGDWALTREECEDAHRAHSQNEVKPS